MKQNLHTEFARRLAAMADKDRRAWRVSIFEETLSIIRNCGYRTQSGVFVPLAIPTDAKSVTVDSENSLPAPTSPSPSEPTEYTVYEGDCLDAAIRLREVGLNPAVLNMANPVVPGGGVKKGAGAQEENIFRRSTYALHLYNKQYAIYPIASTGAIYSPGVWVFRGAEALGYPLLPTPVSLSFIALPALIRPATVYRPDFGEWLSPQDYSLSVSKVNTMLRLALVHGHDSLVLSAWGCGAFRNPPGCIAAVFREALQSPQYLNRFRRVVFAIFDDHNTRSASGNVAPFAAAFGTTPVTEIRSDGSSPRL